MIRNALSLVAAAGLVLAPIVAQANTRAASAGVAMDAGEVDRLGAPVSGELREAGKGIPLWLLIMLFGGTATAIILGVEAGENNKSPGT